jgi:hypothetical protein
MKHAILILFITTVSIALGDAASKADPAAKGVTFFELEFKEKRGESRIYKIGGSKQLDPQNAERVRRAFDTPAIKPPELLDVLVDYFAIRIDGELFYVVEMQHRGFSVTPAKENGENLERLPKKPRLLGKLTKIVDLLDREFRVAKGNSPDK